MRKYDINSHRSLNRVQLRDQASIKWHGLTPSEHKPHESAVRGRHCQPCSILSGDFCFEADGTQHSSMSIGGRRQWTQIEVRQPQAERHKDASEEQGCARRHKGAQVEAQGDFSNQS